MGARVSTLFLSIRIDYCVHWKMLKGTVTNKYDARIIMKMP